MIADAGITSVWLPPPSDSVSPQGYLPRDLYDLNSAYGSEVTHPLAHHRYHNTPVSHCLLEKYEHPAYS